MFLPVKQFAGILLESKYRRGVNTVEENSFANQMDGGGGVAFNEFNKDTVTINTRTFGKNNLCKTQPLFSKGIHISKVPTSMQIFIYTNRCRIGLLNSLQSRTT